MKTYDAVVIGGGIIGLSCTYYLLKKGKSVCLVEKNEIGSGASGACDDMILLQSKAPGISLELAIESLELYRSLPEDLNMDIGFHTRGGMILIDKCEHIDLMNDYVEKQKHYGLDIKIIDKTEVRKKHPYVKENIIASTFGTKDSQVDPMRVLKAFVKNSSDMGMVLNRGKNITEIEKHSSWWKVRFDDESSVETENIIICAGAWSHEVGKLVEVNIPVTSLKGQILVTEQLPPLGKENIWSSDYIVSKLNPELSEGDSTYKKLGIGLSFSQTEDGNYLIGSTREKGIYDKNTTCKAITILTKQITDFFPILKGVNIIRTFAGFRPLSQDGKPIISEVKGKEGLFVATGHGGDGVALAPITGKLMSQLVCGERPSIPLEALSIDRFG